MSAFGSSSASKSNENLPKRYVVVCNIAKQNNVRALINAAVAYNFKVIIIGLERMDFGNTGEKLIRLATCEELKRFLKEENIPLVGIEIMPDAKSVMEDPFESSIALMPGNEGDGLSQRQKDSCDFFLYIPQYGFGTASLNVYIATTIVLHRYNLYIDKHFATENSGVGWNQIIR